MKLFRIALTSTIIALASTSGWGQASGVVGKPLLRTSFTGDDSKETLIVAVEFAPNATTGRHVHPGDEYAAVVEGTLELRLDGQLPRRVSAGQAYHNVRGQVHETVNVGDGPARTIATFVVDKGKPVTSPAP